MLNFEEWEKLAEKASSFITEFLIKPYIRFKGEVGEQATMFFRDPEGNALEFKSFKNTGNLFRK